MTMRIPTASLIRIQNAILLIILLGISAQIYKIMNKLQIFICLPFPS